MIEKKFDNENKYDQTEWFSGFEKLGELFKKIEGKKGLNKSKKFFFRYLIMNYNFKSKTHKSFFMLDIKKSLEYIKSIIDLDKKNNDKSAKVRNFFDCFLRKIISFIVSYKFKENTGDLVVKLKRLIFSFNDLKNSDKNFNINYISSCIDSIINSENWEYKLIRILGNCIYQKLEDDQINSEIQENKKDAYIDFEIIDNWFFLISSKFSLKTIRDEISRILCLESWGALDTLLTNPLDSSKVSEQRSFTFYLPFDGAINKTFFKKNFNNSNCDVKITSSNKVLIDYEKNKSSKSDSNKRIKDMLKSDTTRNYLKYNLKSENIALASEQSSMKFNRFIGSLAISGVRARPREKKFIVSISSENHLKNWWKIFPTDISGFSNLQHNNVFYKNFIEHYISTNAGKSDIKDLYLTIINRFKASEGRYESEFIFNFISLETICSLVGNWDENKNNILNVSELIYTRSFDREIMQNIICILNRADYSEVNSDFKLIEKFKNKYIGLELLSSYLLNEKIRKETFNRSRLFLEYIVHSRNRSVHSGVKNMDYSNLNRFVNHLVITFLNILDVLMDSKKNINIKNIFSIMKYQSKYKKNLKSDLISNYY